MHPQGVRFFDESQQQSFERGLSQGRAVDRAADVLDVLDARGLTVTAAQRERILGTKELDTLTAWLRRAAIVGSADAQLE
jgi:hypothetical protein